MAVEVGAVDRTYIDVFGEGRAGVHADLAAQWVTMPATSERPTILIASPVGPGCRRSRKPIGAAPAAKVRNRPGCGRSSGAIGLGIGDLLGDAFMKADRMQHAERDQVPIGRRG